MVGGGEEGGGREEIFFRELVSFLPPFQVRMYYYYVLVQWNADKWITLHPYMYVDHFGTL